MLMMFGMTFVYAVSQFRDCQTQNDQNEGFGGLEESEFMFLRTGKHSAWTSNKQGYICNNTDGFDWSSLS